MKAAFEKQSVTAEMADKMIAAAAVKATEMGIPMVIAVVDESGVLKAYQRMDGAALLSVEIAQNKAWTAAAFGIATHDFHEFIKSDAQLANGIVHTPRFAAYGGGYPIKIGDTTIGGIGLSGGHYTNDMECAQAGLAALDFEE